MEDEPGSDQRGPTEGRHRVHDPKDREPTHAGLGTGTRTQSEQEGFGLTGGRGSGEAKAATEPITSNTATIKIRSNRTVFWAANV